MTTKLVPVRSLSPLAALVALAAPALAAPFDGEVLDTVLINDVEGGLGPVLHDEDHFGSSIARIGDLNGDGLVDLVVGAPGDDDAGTNAGAVYVLLLNELGEVDQRTKIVNPGGLTDFGKSVAQAGDLNGDGLIDLAVGRREAVELFTLAADGTAAHQATIDSSDYAGTLYLQTGFADSLTRLGDINGDGREELAIGEPEGDGGGDEVGLVHIFTLEPGYDQPHLATIGSAQGGFLGALNDKDHFGRAVVSPGDIDGDGTADLAVGAVDAIWILFLNPDGTVREEQKLDGVHGTPAHVTGVQRYLGRIGDVDAAGGPDLLTAGGSTLRILFLRTDGTVRSFLEYKTADVFGASKSIDALAGAGDHDGDGVDEIALGFADEDGGGHQRGAAGLTFLAEISGAQVAPFGCGLAPAGSIGLSDAPFIGSTFDVRIDNPTGSQLPGALPFVAFGGAPLGGCGAPVPGFSMDVSAPNGAVLVAPPFLAPELIGAPWAGPGQPAAVPVTLPQDVLLLGLPLYTQGLLFDPSGGPTGTVLFGMTNGLVLTIGT